MGISELCVSLVVRFDGYLQHLALYSLSIKDLVR